MLINVLDYLERTMDRTAAVTAFADETGKRTTYADLYHQARALGSALATMPGATANKPVAVGIDRHVSSIIAFLGVAYSGNFYVPIDLQLPDACIADMLAALKSPPFIVPRTMQDRFRNAPDVHAPLIPFDDAISVPIDHRALDTIRARMIDTDPLYAIFTSGSTGSPKCVVVSHRSVIDLIEQFTTTFAFPSHSVVGNQAPFDFDVSVKDIYLTLALGGTMHIIPRMWFAVPGRLIEWMNRTGINVMIWATSALRILANLKALDTAPPRQVSMVMFSGEVMPNKVLNYWRQHLPDTAFVNLYGPTEITCNCTYFKVERPFADDDILPVGIPFRNTGIILLNDRGQQAADGDTGEICVRGTSLAAGYFNHHGATAQAFGQNPLNPFYPEPLYRTGDIGRINERGELLFLGRRDSQVKHRGRRVELGDIEATANALPVLDAAACLHDTERDSLVLFYEAPQSCDLDLQKALRAKLPRYMIPDMLFHMIKLPLNKNGKIDRKVLHERIRHETR